MSHSPSVSVCVTTHDEGSELLATVRSIYQHAAGAEVIVVDDGGTDGSGEKTRDEFPIKFVKMDQPTGAAPAKAHAPKHATGDVLIFLDGHCRLTPGVVDKLVCGAQRYGVVVPLLRGLDEEGNLNGTRCKISRFTREDLVAQYLRDSAGHKIAPRDWQTWRVSGGGCALRRDVYDAIGGWDEGVLSFGSDVSLTLRAWCAGHDIVLLMDAELGHRFRRTFRPGLAPRWAELYANQLRLMTVVGSDEDMRERRERLQAKNKAAYNQAVGLCESNPVPLPQFVRRRTLQDYWADTRQTASEAAILPDPGGGQLEPAAVEYIRQHAAGRCLEFGTGTGTSAKAFLSSDRVTVLVSAEDSPRWIVQASGSVNDHRVMFVVLKRGTDGFYDVQPLLRMGMQFDFVLIDGPPGTKARSQAWPDIVPLLATGATVLVDDGQRDWANIRQWVERHGVIAELLPSHRGLYKITVGGSNRVP